MLNLFRRGNNVDITKESPIILSLCTGLVRGLEVGIEHALQQRIRIAAYVEIEAFVIENLLCGMEKGLLDSSPVWTNLKTFPFSEFRGKVHGIIGGYPCQPFSVAGNQKGVDDPRHLWPYIKDGIEAVRPVFCFFENVRGHLNLGYEQVRRELQRLGYEVREGIYSAQEVGAPHRRDRLFILAIRPDGLSQFNQLVVNADSNGSQGLCAEAAGENGQERRTKRSSTFRIGRASSTTCRLSKNKTRLEKLANANSARLQRRRRTKLPKCSGKCTALPSSAFEETDYLHHWPARPGQQQHDYEEPRVIESGLCGTINGYRFREDLLRGLGNGVVWQTASLAFTDLLKKF